VLCSDIENSLVFSLPPPLPPSLPPRPQRSTIEEQAAATGADKSQRKLEYLMAQSEMFAHFLGAQVSKGGRKEGGRKGGLKGVGTSSLTFSLHLSHKQAFQKKTGKGGGGGAGGKKGSVKMSMEEKDEDAALMKTATSTGR